MFKDSKNYLLASAFLVATNFLTLPIFTSFLSLADYGVVGLFLLFGTTVTSLLSCGLNTATYGLYFKYSAQQFNIIQTTVFSFSVVLLSSVGVFLIFPHSELISQLLFNKELPGVVVKLSFINGCLNYVYVFYCQMLIAQKRSKAFTLCSILHTVINAGSTYYFLVAYSRFFENNLYMAPIYSALISNLVASIIVLYVNRKFFSARLSVTRLKRALKFGLPEVPNVIVSILYTGFDKVMLVNYKSSSAVGHYDFGQRFAGILKIVSDALGKSFSPRFQEKVNSNDSNEEIMSTFYIMTMFLGALAIFISLFAEEGLIILTTEEFYIAKLLVPILTGYYFFSVLTHLSINQLIASEKLYYIAPISVIGLSFNILLNIMLIPTYGAIGAAIATATAGLITSCIQVYVANKALSLGVHFQKLIKFYAVVLIYLALAYPIIIDDQSLFIKVIMKALILMSFLIVAINMDLVDARIIKDKLRSIFSYSKHNLK